MKTFLHILSIALMALTLSACGGSSQFDMTERPDATGSILRMTDTYYIATDRFGEIRQSGISTGLAYEYDRNGRLTSQTLYDNKGSISWLAAYEYDGNGHLTKYIERQPDKDDIVCPVVENGYTRVINKPNGTTIRKIEGCTVSEYENDKLVAKYVYDERGRITFQESFLDNDSQTYRYNEDGLSFYCLADAQENWESEVRPVEFDSHGNWTKAYMYYRGKVIFVRERTFTYWN